MHTHLHNVIILFRSFHSKYIPTTHPMGCDRLPLLQWEKRRDSKGTVSGICVGVVVANERP